MVGAYGKLPGFMGGGVLPPLVFVVLLLALA